jgi:hypothetical protein
MSGYGQVLSGGAAMRKGVTKGINDKLDALEDKREAREKLANQVKQAFKGTDLSSPKVNNVQVGQKSDKFGGKKGNNFTITKSPKNI